MANSLNLTGAYRDELAELADVAGNLAAGNGGPSRYRKPANGMSALPDHGRADLNVVCLEVPHRPMAALLVAALVLYGLHFQDDLARLGIHEISIDVFETLQREFGPVSPGILGADPPSRIALSDNAHRGLTAALGAPTTKGKRSVLTMTFPESQRPPAGVIHAPKSKIALPPGVGLPALQKRR